MFFMMSSYPKQEELPYNNNMKIHDCGKYQRARIIMQYYVLSLFFIPVFKFKKRYFVSFDCCNKTFELKKEVGKEIERGNSPEFSQDDYIYEYSNEYRTSNNSCPYCGYHLDSDFDYCPKCGNKIR